MPRIPSKNDARSRNGCIACRQRHRKCGEEKPKCQKCIKSNILCEYNNTHIQWSLVEGPATFKWRQTVNIHSSGAEHRRKTSWSELEPASFPESSHIRDRTTSHHSSPETRVEKFTSSSIPALPSANSVDEEDVSDLGYSRSSSVSTEDIQSDTGRDDRQIISSGWALNYAVIDDRSRELIKTPGDAIAFTYYIRHVSGILPAYDRESNPYRMLSHLALSAPVLLDTIVSLATTYMYNQGGLSNTEILIKRQSRALVSLRDALLQISTTGDENDELLTKATLAAALLQICYLIISGGTEIDPHFLGALHLMRRLNYLSVPINDAISRILVQRFAIIDVVRTIYRRTRPLSPSEFWFYNRLDSYDDWQSSFRDMTGCPHPVLTFLIRAAHLTCDITKTETPTLVIKRAFALESEMHIYKDTAQLDELGECFYWTALVILQRRVYREPTRSRRVQFTATTVFEIIEKMPPGCGPDSSVYMPFFIVAREAVMPEHREWVRQKNSDLGNVYHDRAIDDCMTVLEDMWRCVDAYGDPILSPSGDVEEALLGIESRSRCFAF